MTRFASFLVAAGLVETLSGKGPFTVFAPTNDAFKKLLLPENKAMLTSILTYHVVPGAYKTSDLKNGMKLTTVQGQQLKVSKIGRLVRINGVRIQTRDVISSNGVTLVINAVLMPR